MNLKLTSTFALEDRIYSEDHEWDMYPYKAGTLRKSRHVVVKK